MVLSIALPFCFKRVLKNHNKIVLGAESQVSVELLEV